MTTPRIIHQRTSLRLDAITWVFEAHDAILDLFRQHILRKPQTHRKALTPNGTPIYGKRTLRRPNGYR
jgi:hypothetical protein